MSNNICIHWRRRCFCMELYITVHEFEVFIKKIHILSLIHHWKIIGNNHGTISWRLFQCVRVEHFASAPPFMYLHLLYSKWCEQLFFVFYLLRCFLIWHRWYEVEASNEWIDSPFYFERMCYDLQLFLNWKIWFLLVSAGILYLMHALCSNSLMKIKITDTYLLEGK